MNEPKDSVPIPEPITNPITSPKQPGYSALVEMWVEIRNHRYDVTQLSADWILLKEELRLPPCDGRLFVCVEKKCAAQHVRFPDGIGTDEAGKAKIAAVPIAGKYNVGGRTMTAIRWFRNGDHYQDDVFRKYENGQLPTEAREGAKVRYFRHPLIRGENICHHCGFDLKSHGWIDGTISGQEGESYVVCPGDWILAPSEMSERIIPVKPFVFGQLVTSIS